MIKQEDNHTRRGFPPYHQTQRKESINKGDQTLADKHHYTQPTQPCQPMQQKKNDRQIKKIKQDSSSEETKRLNHCLFIVFYDFSGSLPYLLRTKTHSLFLFFYPLGVFSYEYLIPILWFSRDFWCVMPCPSILRYTSLWYPRGVSMFLYSVLWLSSVL